MHKYTAEQLLERAAVWTMRSIDFVSYAGVVMVGATRIEDDPARCPTAYTDGLNCVYGRKFIEGLSEPEIRFVVLHENLHKMFRHMIVWRHLFERSPMLANVSCDYVINAILVDTNDPDIARPQGTLYDPKYAGWDAQKVFNDLLKNAKHIGKCSGQCKQGSGNGNANGQCTCPQGFDDHGWEEANSLPPSEQQAAQQAIDSAIRQGSILAGRMGAKIDRRIGELLEVRADYKTALRDFLTNVTRGGDETTWARPNRRHLQYDEYMPSTQKQSMGRMLLAIDTSGSIAGEQLTYFLSNVAHILKTVAPEGVDLVYWDTAVAGHETYEPAAYDTLPSSTKPKGGGGTAPSCVTKWLKEKNLKPQVAVILSDGYVGGDYGGAWPCPTLWAIQGDKGFTPPTGQVIQLPADLR